MVPDVAFHNTMDNICPVQLKKKHASLDWIQLSFYYDAQKQLRDMELRLIALRRFTALYPWLHLTGQNPIQKQKAVFRLYLLYRKPHC